MELKLSGNVSDTDLEEDETALGSLAGGCSLDFNQHSEHLFIVGTEEGRIHKCSKAYHSQYLETYKVGASSRRFMLYRDEFWLWCGSSGWKCRARCLEIGRKLRIISAYGRLHSL